MRLSRRAGARWRSESLRPALDNRNLIFGQAVEVVKLAEFHVASPFPTDAGK